MMRALVLLSSTVILFTGCAAPAQLSQAPSTGPAAQQGPRVLTIAELREPATLYGFTGEGGSGGGVQAVGGLVHDSLARTDAFEVLHQGLAVEVPSVERGSWRINPDGTMDLTWKLKPGVKWQDGAPFASDDMMFTLALHKDPDLQHSNASTARLMASATNPDPSTFILHWSRIDVLAATPRALTPFPKHLLEELYRGDKTAFQNSPFFREQFVGLGPYRLSVWERGSHIEAVRFDDFHQGRPPLDKITVKYITDQNTMVANILSGAIDVIMPKSLDLDVALQVRRQWEGTGHLVRVEPIPRIAYLELMLRPEYARPANAFTNLAVRQGLYHAIDRQGITEVATGGLGPIADSWYDPTDPLRREFESSIVKYPHDLNRAQQLLTLAGWTRGSDGVLTHTSGDRLDTEVWVNPQTADAAAAIVVDSWKRVGVNATLHEIPAARAQDRSYSAQRPGPLVTGAGTTGTGIVDRYDSRDVASAANQWAGRNRSGYANPRADEVLDKLKMTVDPRERLPLLQEQIRIFTSDVVLMPLYWEPGNMAAVKGVKADIHPNAPNFNMHLWDRD